MQFKHAFIKRLGLLSLFFILPTINLQLLRFRQNYLYQYIDLNSKFSYLNALWLIVFIAVFVYLFASLGRFFFQKLKLKLSASFQIAFGLLVLNIYFLPFFFLNLLRLPIIILIFLPLLILIAYNPYPLENFYLKLSSKLSLNKFYPIIFFLAAISLHFIDSLMPFDFQESSGDIAINYLRIPMAFAQAGGAYHSKLLASSLAGLVNYEAFSAVLIVFTNPQVIKLFGFFIFCLSFFLLYDFLKKILKLKFSLATSTIFLFSPFFIDKLKFSFAHPRVYLLLITLLSFCLIYLGYSKRKPQYHWLSLISLGILATTTYQGFLAAATFFVYLMPSLIKSIKKTPKLFFLIFFILASIFPFWIYYHQGSPFPKIPLFNQLLSFKPDFEMSSNWINERVLVQISSKSDIKFIKNLFNTSFSFIYYSLGPLTLFFFLSLFFIKDTAIKLSLSFCFIYIMILFSFFPSATLLSTNHRFQIITLPLLIISTTKSLNLISNKLSQSLSQINLQLELTLQKLVRSHFFNLFWRLRHFFGSSLLKILFIFSLLYLFGHLLFLRNVMLNHWLIFSLITFLFFNFFISQLIGSVKQKLPVNKLLSLNLVFVLLTSFVIIKFHLLVSAFTFLSAFSSGLKRIHLILLWLVFISLDYLIVFIKLSIKNQPAHVKSFTPFSRKQLKLALPLVVYFSLILIIISSFKTLLRKDNFIKKFLFLSKNINHSQYLGWRDSIIAEQINKNFTEDTKIIYFFHAINIYSKAQLYQPSTTSIVSYLYQPDVNLALNKLKQEGINYLILDNRWKISANNPSLSMIADITSPLFTPQLFSRHFVLIPSNIPGFYLFQINYQGLKEEALNKNFQAILDEGFFCLIFSSLTQKSDQVLILKSNPYSYQQLIFSYKNLGINFCPNTIKKCFYYHQKRPQDCFAI